MGARWIMLFAIPILAGGWWAGAAEAPIEATMWVLDRQGQKPEPRVAIKDVTAWPNLTRLPNGDIVALIYNQHSHGRLPGDVDCWVSTDEGEMWIKRSTAAPRGTPEQNRMNVAAGLTADGNLILVTSGWSNPGNTSVWSKIGHVLPTWVCISKDNGTTWNIDKESFPSAPDGRPLIPFGDIMPGADGKLRVAAYGGPRGPADGEVPPVPEDDPLAQRAAAGQNWVVRGDGQTWDPPVPIGDRPGRYNETAPLHLGDGKWLAAARNGLMLFYSEDDARTWKDRGKVANGIPAHLTRLADGSILLSYGMRTRPRGVGGVEVKFSDDDGQTWSEAYRILDVQPGHGDLGYPSSVQRKDGQIVTAYYEGNPRRAHSYRMGVVIWDPVKTRNGAPILTDFQWAATILPAQILFDAKKYQEAREALDTLADTAPNPRAKADILALAALALAHQEQYDQALARVPAIEEPAVADYTRMQILTLAGKPADLIAAFQDADLTVWPADLSYQGYLVRGNAYHALENGPAAVRDWERALELAGERPHVRISTLTQIGHAYQALGKDDEALAAYRKALAAMEAAGKPKPVDYASLVVTVARLLIDRSQPEAALALLDQLDPSTSTTWGLKALDISGDLYSGMGKKEQALAKYQEGHRLAEGRNRQNEAGAFAKKIAGLERK